MRILQFIWCVLNNRAGYVTGGLLVGAVTFYFMWRDKPAPRNVMFVLCVFALLLAFYKAWDDQYRENQVGRDAGSLFLAALNGDVAINAATHKSDVQLTLVLKNLQPRLVKYRMDTFDLELESTKPSAGFSNDSGGLLYAGQSWELRSPPILGMDMQKACMEGRLTYAMTYNVVGS